MHFDASHLAAAAGVVAAASRAPRRQRSAQDAQGLDFLRRPSMAMGPEDLRREQERPGYVLWLSAYGSFLWLFDVDVCCVIR